MITYLFLFSVLLGATDATAFRLEYPTNNACLAARETFVQKTIGPTGTSEVTGSALIICSSDPVFPTTLAIGMIPVTPLGPLSP